MEAALAAAAADDEEIIKNVQSGQIVSVPFLVHHSGKQCFVEEENK